MMKRLHVAGCLALLALACPAQAQDGQLIKVYDNTTGTEEPFSATGAWQFRWSSGDRSSGFTVRIEDATTGAYVSEAAGISGAVRVDASGTFRVITKEAPSRYKITISTIPR
ncbi:MAG: hypothetical protein DI629_01015 [Mesorhizobium amorphae]|nr:MAG: hypothetical protein DI629_01015 [Mesorhizobium amorphae]